LASLVAFGAMRSMVLGSKVTFQPVGAEPDSSTASHIAGFGLYLAKLAVLGFLLAVFETAIAKMRVFRLPDFVGGALMLGLLGTLLLFVSRSL